MSKQEKSLIQNPIAIPEPTNEVNALWRTCQALKEAVEILQGERGNREAALKVDLNDLRDELIQGNISVGSVAPGGATTTLFDLTDTTLDAQIQGSFLYNQDGTQWYPSIDAVWDDANDQFKFTLDTALIWIDPDGPVNVNGASFQEVYTGPSPTPDPDLGDVIFLSSVEGATGVSPATPLDIVDVGTGAVRWESYQGSTSNIVEISQNQAKFGTQSLRCNGVLQFSSGTFGTYIYSNSYTDTDLQFGTDDWTLECHFYAVSSGVNDAISPILTIDTTRGGLGPSQYILRWVLSSSGQIMNGAVGYNNGGAHAITGFTSASTGMVRDTWYHIVLQRFGQQLQGFVDGVRIEDFSMAGSPTSLWVPTSDDVIAGLQLGGSQGSIGSRLDYYLDNIRVTRGVARYPTASFTPPAAPYQGTPGDKSFIAGDANYPTVINGSTVSVNTNAVFSASYNDEDISPLQLTDPFTISRPAGYGTMVQITVSNTTLNTATNVWHTRVVCDGTCTVNVDSATHADVPDGAVFWVLSTTGVTTLAGTTSFTVDKFLGVGVVTGSVTIAAGGWATVVKHSATKLYVTGVGVT